MTTTLPVFFVYIYHIPVYTLIVVRKMFNFVIAFLPSRQQQQIRCTRDSIAALAFIAFGPLLPKLHVPDVNLSGKTAIVTGANSGIGLQIASDLAQRNATVYLACRTKFKAEKAIQTIIEKVPHADGKVHFVELDTSSLVSVRNFAESWIGSSASKGVLVNGSKPIRAIDILVHNAGIASPPENQAFSSEGLEILYATNFLGSFLLTYLLKDHLTATARIVLTSSTAQYSSNISPSFAVSAPQGETNVFEPGFHCPATRSGPRAKVEDTPPFAIYSNTKAMQGAFARSLQQRFNKSSPDNMKVVHYFSPDLTSTPILGRMEGTSIVADFAQWTLNRLKSIAISVEQGAATGSWLAVEQHDERVINPKQGGAYWDQMYRLTSVPDLFDQDLLDRLWKRWESDADITWQ